MHPRCTHADLVVERWHRTAIYTVRRDCRASKIYRRRSEQLKIYIHKRTRLPRMVQLSRIWKPFWSYWSNWLLLPYVPPKFNNPLFEQSSPVKQLQGEQQKSDAAKAMYSDIHTPRKPRSCRVVSYRRASLTGLSFASSSFFCEINICIRPSHLI